MTRQRAPSARKAPAITPWLHGQRERRDGQEFVSALVRRSTARVLQEAREHEQAAALGRDRYERREAAGGYRHGSEAGTVKTAAGVRRVQGPQVRGLREPSRSNVWSALGRTSDVLATRIVERSAGGLSQRASEMALEQALGPCVASKSAIRDRTDRLAHAYEAFRPRHLRGYDRAYVYIATVSEP